ncbi:MAG: UDP-N-acetylmuramoyl-tripeptide--D-alanyl-D-alanine ligase [Pseudomonadales bacterium]|jgi:UDP-N-acetylmuramoyl-tripeptide--D-alanyl-D-alanine ligase
MMRAQTLFAVADACGVARSAVDATFTRVETDSRKVQSGDLFVALKGDRFDAHDFLVDVQRAGAIAAVVEKISSDISLPQLLVKDTVQALGEIAALNRDLFAGRVIGLTGSAGKTTTKEMIAAILAQQGKPWVTQGNLNNHLGVPMTLLALSPEHDCAVIEMGASALDEIRYLTQMVKPDVALVTNVGAAHLEGFGSVENIAAGKREIFEGLAVGGTAVINLDNVWTAAYRTALPASVKVVTFSAEKSADVFASNTKQSASGVSFTLHAQNASHPVVLQFLGVHNVSNALAAAACCLALGLSLDVVSVGLCAAKPYKGRLQTRKGIEGCRVIDDSYNASPTSVRAAIDTLLQCAGEKILVLGDMAELGADAKALHTEIGVYAKNTGIKTLLVTGELSRATAEAFGAGAQHFSTWELLAAQCVALANKQSIFLVKGSRSAGMDRVADKLAATEELLC